MELRDYLSILRKRWVSVVAVTLSVLALTAVATLATTPTYTARVSLFFAVGGSGSVSDLVQGSNFAQQQVESYVEVATAPYVLQPVIEDLELDTSVNGLSEKVHVSVPLNTVIIEIAVNDEAPQRAADIANGIGRELAAAVTALSPAGGDEGEPVRATPISSASAPTSPSAPNTPRNLALGLTLGLLGGLGLALLLEILNTRVRTESDIGSVTDSSVLTHVPKDESGADHPVFMHDDPTGLRSESIRRLRTNLQFVDFADRTRSIVITSSVPGEGKTTTAINLAASLADAGARVILVDADLRRPTVAKYLGFEGRVGLTTVLIGRANVGDVVQPWQDSTLDVLASGQVPPNPSELLGSRAMDRLLTDLAASYDVIVIDSPPLLPVTDAAILSKMAGGTLVVASAEGTHKPQLRTALESLEQVDAHVLGIVLNKVTHRERDKYAYEYYATNDPAVTGRRSTRHASPSSNSTKRSTWPGERLSSTARR